MQRRGSGKRGGASSGKDGQGRTTRGARGTHPCVTWRPRVNKGRTDIHHSLHSAPSYSAAKAFPGFRVRERGHIDKLRALTLTRRAPTRGQLSAGTWAAPLLALVDAHLDLDDWGRTPLHELLFRMRMWRIHGRISSRTEPILGRRYDGAVAHGSERRARPLAGAALSRSGMRSGKPRR